VPAGNKQNKSPSAMAEEKQKDVFGIIEFPGGAFSCTIHDRSESLAVLEVPESGSFETQAEIEEFRQPRQDAAHLHGGPLVLLRGAAGRTSRVTRLSC